MTVLLINPPPLKRIQQFQLSSPHIGLAYLAASLEENNIESRVIDCRLSGISDSNLKDSIFNYDFEIVGITSMTHNIEDMVRVATYIKEKKPTTPLILGGPHATAIPKETLEQYSCIDYIVMGEGEITFPRLVKHLLNGETQEIENEEGVAYGENGNIRVNPARKWIEDLDSLPFPAWEKFDLTKVNSFHVLGKRGCPFKCKFCMRSLGNKVRKRKPSAVVEEIERNLTEFHIGEFDLIDETSTVDSKWINEFLDLLMSRGLADKVKWSTTTRVNRVNKNLIKKMKKSGCFYLGFGIESGNQQMLSRVNKGITLEQAKQAVQWTKETGVKVGTFFIIGHPHESLKTALETINFSAKLNPDKVAFGIMTPYPGTEIYEMAKKGEGGYKIISEDWTDYSKSFSRALETENLNYRQLKLLQMFGYSYVHLKNLRLKDFLSLFSENKRAILHIAKDILSSKRIRQLTH